MSSTASERSPGVRIRTRTAVDLPGCVKILAEVHTRDGYPMLGHHVSEVWLTELDGPDGAAWIAELDRAVVGHAQIRSGIDWPTSRFESTESAASPEEFLGLSRLFVAPVARGHGVAGRLLDVVDAHARRVDRPLALDVVEKNATAVALYERRGWQMVGRSEADWFGPDGPHPWVRHYVGPTR